MIQPLEQRLLQSTMPNDPSYASEWGLSAIAASNAWDTTKGSAAAAVAGMAAGIESAPPVRSANVWIGQNGSPAAGKQTVKAVAGDEVLTFCGRNASPRQGKVTAGRGNRRIDG